MQDVQAAKPPLTYWIVSVVSLLWNSFGALDYTMTKTRNMAYLAGAAGSEEKARAMLAQLDALPAFATALWAIGVWGALLGAVLLLLRSRHAPTAFLVSLIGAVLSFGYQLTTPLGVQMRTGAGLAMMVVILGSVIFFWWYGRRAAAKGLLR